MTVPMSELEFREGQAIASMRELPGHRAEPVPVRTVAAFQPVRALTESDDQVRDAAASCPVEAILLTDTDTGKPVPLDDD